MDLNLRRTRKNYKNNQKMDNYCVDLLRGKIEFLLSDYGIGETCKISTSMVERILNILKKQGKENAIVEHRIVRGGIEKNYVLLGINDQIIKIDLRLGMAEISNCTKIINADEKTMEYIDLEDLSIEEKEEPNYIYTLDDFILDTNVHIRTKKLLPGFRLTIVCKDGYMLSVQASRFAASKPKENNRTDYTHFEVNGFFEDIPELKQYEKLFSIGDFSRKVYEYVPKKLVESILEKHGGIDEEKTFAPTELHNYLNDNFGLNYRMGYLDDVLKRVDRYDELNEVDEKDLEEEDLELGI